jgi:hypothetical protein
MSDQRGKPALSQISRVERAGWHGWTDREGAASHEAD